MLSVEVMHTSVPCLQKQKHERTAQADITGRTVAVVPAGHLSVKAKHSLEKGALQSQAMDPPASQESVLQIELPATGRKAPPPGGIMRSEFSFAPLC